MIDCEGSIDMMRGCDDAARSVTLSVYELKVYAAGGCCWVLRLGAFRTALLRIVRPSVPRVVDHSSFPSHFKQYLILIEGRRVQCNSRFLFKLPQLRRKN
jgi:hypothetical protein